MSIHKFSLFSSWERRWRFGQSGIVLRLVCRWKWRFGASYMVICIVHIAPIGRQSTQRMHESMAATLVIMESLNDLPILSGLKSRPITCVGVEFETSRSTATTKTLQDEHVERHRKCVNDSVNASPNVPGHVTPVSGRSCSAR